MRNKERKKSEKNKEDDSKPKSARGMKVTGS